MKPNPKSMNEPRGYSGASRSRASTNVSTNSVTRQLPRARISPWLPIAFGAFTLLVVTKAMSASSRPRSWQERVMSSANNRWNDWWPDIRDTAEETGSRARSWFNDVAPSRRSVSNILASGADWLPDARVSKRRLLANLDWANPPRWLSEVDLSTTRKRRRFLRDLKRYGSRQGDSLMSSLGLR